MYPHLECELVLQDLPETSSLIEKGKLDARIRMMEDDFFTAQTVLGSSIFHPLR